MGVVGWLARGGGQADGEEVQRGSWEEVGQAGKNAPRQGRALLGRALQHRHTSALIATTWQRALLSQSILWALGRGRQLLGTKRGGGGWYSKR